MSQESNITKSKTDMNLDIWRLKLYIRVSYNDEVLRSNDDIKDCNIY